MKIVKKSSNETRIKKAIKDTDRISFAVGWGKNQKYEDGTPVAAVAVTQEFGDTTRHIPPRPFMRPAVENNGNNWKKQFAGGIKKVLHGEILTGEVVETIALLAEGDIKKAIKAVTSPPLKTSTVMARLKGKKQGKAVSLTAAKPLVDTGDMLDSITHEEIEK